MYTITYIQGQGLFSISTPSLVTACRTFYNLRIKAGLTARMWKNTKTLIFWGDKMLTILVNIEYAIRNNQSIKIGGGIFSPEEMAELLDYIASLEENNNAKR